MINKIIGRDSACDHVILDPKNRVSRRHAAFIKVDGKCYIKDLGSLNGTCINGNKIIPEKLIQVSVRDKITLSIDYPLDISSFFIDDDVTNVLSKSTHDDATLVFGDNLATFRKGQKTVEFDRDKTQLGELLKMDDTPFITIGRNSDNKFVINSNNISRYHCKIRLITPIMVEIEDLGSANGSYADEEKLEPNKKYQFASSVILRFGSSYQLNLKSIFPTIQIIQKASPPKPVQQTASKPTTAPSKKQLEDFNELEGVWKEFIDRQNQANNAATGYGIGGTVLGIAASIFLAPVTGGSSIIATVASAGGGILGRYLGQQQSSKIRNDLTYEDAFLQTYACPVCRESFQKKPWITIRECFKCKSKFR
jgi:pSer/pThr/pTyr-binding forkhead associated (FHA) protein/ribosomal protein L37AE/L43A